MRVHSLPKGVSIAPMPKLDKSAEINRKLQGGLAPVPYRSCTAKWGQGNKQKSAPKEIIREKNGGLRGYDKFMARPPRHA